MSNSSRLAVLFTILLASLGLVAVYLILEFGIYLGFSLERLSMYTMATTVAAISLVAPLGVWNRFSSIRSLRLTGRRGIALTVGVSLAVRLYFALTASIYPDEFGTLLILAKRPLEDITAFLLKYEAYAGSYVTHPPLGFLLMSFGYSLVPSHLGPRIISVTFSIAAILVVYRIISELECGNPLYPTVLFAFIPHTVVFFSLATTDVYMNFFGMLGFYFCLRAIKSDSMVKSFLAGLLIGLSLWSKGSLSVFWVGLCAVAVILLAGRRCLRRLETLGIICIVAFLTYLPWYSLNAYAFYSSLQPLQYVILGALGIKGYKISSLNPVFPAGTGRSPLISWMASIFPRLWAGTSTISYVELLVQLPLWITPIVSLLLILGFLNAVRRLNRLNTLLLLWLLIPFLGMLGRFRDVRYLLISGIPICLLTVAGGSFSGGNLQLRIRSLTLGFIAIFLAMSAPIVQQQYYGVEQAASEIKDLGLEDSTILTNCRDIEYYLPNTTFIYIVPNQNSKMIRDIVLAQGVTAVLILNNARGAWPQIDNSTREFLVHHFNRHLSNGLSQFSWFELFYNASEASRS